MGVKDQPSFMFWLQNQINNGTDPFTEQRKIKTGSESQ